MYYLFSTAGLKRDEVTEEWRKLNEEFNNLYSLPNTVRVIKSRTMWWAVQVACMGKSRGVYRVLVETPEGKYHLENTGVGGKIILRWIFRKWDVRAWTG